MASPRKKKKQDEFEKESSDLSASFAQAFRAAPKPPGHDIVPKKQTATPVEVRARYGLLKKRVRTRLAERFIDEEDGQTKYITGGVYAVAGKFKLRGELMDWDHELRNIEAKSDERVQLELMAHVAKRLGVRT